MAQIKRSNLLIKFFPGFFQFPFLLEDGEHATSVSPTPAARLGILEVGRALG
jgi:hypothetical protein